MMFKTLVNAFKVKEIRKKILITLAIVLVYRVCCFIPIPGLSIEAVQLAGAKDSLMDVINAITGGALSQGTLLALGIVPFINASIIMQLLTIVIPHFERLSKEGEEGKKKMSQYTRIFAVVLAMVQAVGVVISWNNAGAIKPVFGSVTVTAIIIGGILVAGSMLAMWIGERITEHGIGNGTSLIIFIGILSTVGMALFNSVTGIGTNIANLWSLIIFLALVILIFGFIVWIDLSERRIQVQYAKQVKGNKMYGGQSTHIPIKVNSAGVLPIIFASAILMFPQLVASLFGTDTPFYEGYSRIMGAGTILYSVLLPLLIVFFAYFYAQVQFNPDDVARNIQQNGGFIPGIRPGKPSADYLRKINNRITLFGAIFLAVIALIPSVVFASLARAGIMQGMLTGAFTATGMMIVVSVALEFNKQLEAQLMMKHYKGFLK